MDNEQGMLKEGYRRCPACGRLMWPTVRGNAPAHGIGLRYGEKYCAGSGQPVEAAPHDAA